MSADIYRVSKVCWAVKSPKLEEVNAFATIEGAADCLEQLGIPSDEIDEAIIALHANGHTHAQFGVMGGTFMFSSDDKLDEKVGIA